jgi:hypothetical protein
LRMADYEELVMLTMVEICGNVDDECRVGCWWMMCCQHGIHQCISWIISCFDAYGVHILRLTVQGWSSTSRASPVHWWCSKISPALTRKPTASS